MSCPWDKKAHDFTHLDSEGNWSCVKCGEQG